MRKVSIREIDRRLRALETVRGQARRLREELRNIDIKSHMAPVYHPLHDDISQGGHEFYNLPGGRGSGKSSFCGLEVVYQIMDDETGLSNALVVRKWAVTLRGSVFSQIQWAIDVLGVSEYWKSTLNPMEFVYLPTGQVIRLTGLDDPQKLKSIKPSRGYFRFLWLEEFSEISGEMELRNLQQSVLRGGDRFTVFRSFNPPISKANWANSYISIPDERSITLLTNYLQIPVDWLGQSFFDEAQRLKELNPRAYDNEYLGLAVGNGSEVFENLEIREIPDEEYSQLSKIYCGIDWGFASDPACFLRVSYEPKTETIWIMDEVYGTHMRNSQLAERIMEKGFNRIRSPDGYISVFYDGKMDMDQLIFCDSAEPKSIQDLRDTGLYVLPCHKFPGCVEYRLKWLQWRKIICDPSRTPNTARELQKYSYEVDKRTGMILSSVPDKDNHSIDSLAYALDQVIYDREYKA